MDAGGGRAPAPSGATWIRVALAIVDRDVGSAPATPEDSAASLPPPAPPRRAHAPPSKRDLPIAWGRVLLASLPVTLRDATLPPFLALLLCACPGQEDPPPGCGNGLSDEFEECDDGEENSDSSRDACRTDCTLPGCGDGTADSGEDCDDGGAWGGDGCSPTCHDEAGRGEQESNNDAPSAEPLASGEAVTGALPAGDVDCFAVEVAQDGWLSADVEGEDPGTCPEETAIRLLDPALALLEVATPTLEGEGCSPIDPLAVPAARFMAGGTWTLCLEGLGDRPVPTYRLAVTLGDDSCGLDFPYTTDDDPDGDLLPDVCDPDDDGDLVADADDDCPLVPDGGLPQGLQVDSQGFVRDWLLAGPFAGHETTLDCRPSEDEILGNDAAAVPRLGDPAAEGIHWFAFFAPSSRVDFLDTIAGPTPREVYAATWIHADEAAEVTLALGPDDGARAWLRGEQVADISGCQGTNVDQFQSDVTLEAGWNRLLLKVRDQGGAWGMYVRFLDASGLPVTGLGVSPSPDGDWAPGQSDLDGDGLGDVCDPAPAGG